MSVVISTLVSMCSQSPSGAVDPRSVFVVHGRNAKVRDAVFDFLRALDLKPIQWETAVEWTAQGSPYIGDVLEAAFANAQAAVVLFTPDEVAYLHGAYSNEGEDNSPVFQARPNVFFEAGMAMGKWPERTIFVECGQSNIPSDMHGRHTVRLSDSTQARQVLANRLKTAGCLVDMSGTDWQTAGDLTLHDPSGLPLGKRLPASKASSVPRLDASYRRGSNSMSIVSITNHGPGDVFDISLKCDDVPDLISMAERDSIPTKLPAGKSFPIHYLRTMASRLGTFFNIYVTGKTEAGEQFTQELYVSTE